MSELEPLPRRNLGDGEHWGRILESRFERVRSRSEALSQSLGGTNRNSSATLGELQRRAAKLAEGLGNVPVARQASVYNSNFTVPQAWTIRADAMLVVPPRKTRLDLTARGSVNIDWVAASGGGGGERFHWPFSLSSVSQEYGPNSAYSDGMHKGIDFSQGGGTPIVAPGSGTVATKSYDSERGNYIIIDHGDGLRTWYYHLNAPSPLNVGNAVTKGSTVVGYVGTTGFSTGNHLHWETRVDGNHMNPRDFMAQYANSAPSSIPFDFDCRLSLDGVIVNHFRSSRESVTGDNRFFIAGGRSFMVNPGSAVSAQIHLTTTNGLENPAYPATFAALTVFGIFS